MRRLWFWIAGGLLGAIWVHPVRAQDQTRPEAVFRPGTNGVGYPRCVYCPAPRLPATPKQTNRAFVALEAIIRPNGRATDIKVTKSAGSDLDQKALEAVKTWRFKPALDENGKPVPTITAIAIMFEDGSGRSTKGWATGASAEYVNSVRNSGNLIVMAGRPS
jgi:TonB family protein